VRRCPVLDLEQELRRLSGEIDVPAPPDVTVVVRRRIAEPAPRRPAPLASGWWSWVTLAAVLVAVVAVAFAIVPQVRATAGDLFRFAGVDVQWGEPAAPAAPVAPLPSQRDIADIDAAQRSAAFPIGVPGSLGAPDRVLVADGGRVVSLLYGASGDAIRLDEFDGMLDPVFAKTVGSAATHVDVLGADGLWFSEPHSVTYVGRDGRLFDESARLSGATLIWQSVDVTYRLEGNLDLAEARAIAESVR
jgi:hypothetical protein